jgi:hypothetical protein
MELLTSALANMPEPMRSRDEAWRIAANIANPARTPDPLMRGLSSPLLRHRLAVLTTQAVEDVNLGHLFQVKIAY